MNNDKYFSKEEIENFKKGSLPFPLIVYEGTDPDNVVEVNEIVRISGMAQNSGNPLSITIAKHVKGKAIEHFTYKLDK